MQLYTVRVHVLIICCGLHRRQHMEWGFHALIIRFMFLQREYWNMLLVYTHALRNCTYCDVTGIAYADSIGHCLNVNIQHETYNILNTSCNGECQYNNNDIFSILNYRINWERCETDYDTYLWSFYCPEHNVPRLSIFASLDTFNILKTDWRRNADYPQYETFNILSYTILVSMPVWQIRDVQYFLIFLFGAQDTSDLWLATQRILT